MCYRIDRIAISASGRFSIDDLNNKKKEKKWTKEADSNFLSWRSSSFSQQQANVYLYLIRLFFSNWWILFDVDSALNFSRWKRCPHCFQEPNERMKERKKERDRKNIFKRSVERWEKLFTSFRLRCRPPLLLLFYSCCCVVLGICVNCCRSSESKGEQKNGRQNATRVGRLRIFQFKSNIRSRFSCWSPFVASRQDTKTLDSSFAYRFD